MAILRMKEISSMSSEDRAKKLLELRAELSRLRTMISAGGAIENPTRVWELRKTIARIITIEHEHKLGIRKTETKEKEPKKAEAKKAKSAKPKVPKEKKPA